MNHAKMNDELAGALRDEGRAMTPVFSEALHERIMARVGEVSQEVIARRGYMRPLRLAAGIAVVLSAGVMVMWMMRPRAEVVKVETPAWVANPAGLAGVWDEAGPLGERLGKEWREGRMAYLDQDGRRLAVFVRDSLGGAVSVLPKVEPGRSDDVSPAPAG